MLFTNAVNRTTRLLPPAHIFTDAMQAVAALFQVASPPIERERASRLSWLVAFMVAGAVVRFWGLGAVGLHGDEETMALAARHILIDGRPILPSGMFYPRALTQIYLMALSISIFGESEWALRLPSALCGIALIALAYVVGRRFLRPHWNLAFAATIALLPDLIVDSQTARMYIFLVTAVMASMACLFAWERTDRTGWLCAAAFALLIGVELHALAIGAVLIFLLPGVLRADSRKLLHGGVAVVVVIIGFQVIDALVNAQYPVPPPEFAADLGPPPWQRARAPQGFALSFDIALWGAGLAIAFFAVHAARIIAGRGAMMASVAVLLAGIGLQLALYYHLAVLAYLAGVTLARRYGGPQANFRLLLFLAAAALLALIHTTLLAATPGSVIKLVGAMVGQPSVWPYVRVAELSPAAGVITAALLGVGVLRFAQRRRAPDYWLLALLGVWIPVFALGLFAWNVPSRYTSMSLAPMLLCAFAFAQHVVDRALERMPRILARGKWETICATAVAVCAINPLAAAAVVDAGYRLHPDHKGAAQFMRTQQITEDDIVLAEDVLQQTYYLGAVDYWLIGRQVARRYVKRAGEGVVDFYTGTPVIATRAMLDELLQSNQGKRIFIVGSGEGQRDQRRTARGQELHEAIESDRFEAIYLGRDRLTRVLRARPGAVAPSASISVESKDDEQALAADAADAELLGTSPAAAPTPAE